MAKTPTDDELIAHANDTYGQYCRHELKVTDMENSVEKLKAMQRCINQLLKRGYTYTADMEAGKLHFAKEK